MRGEGEGGSWVVSGLRAVRCHVLRQATQEETQKGLLCHTGPIIWQIGWALTAQAGNGVRLGTIGLLGQDSVPCAT